MNKVPTVYDVAERAGVSIATVSFVFRKPERVKESTRELVRAVARELGYVPSASARGLAAGRTGVLGIYSFNMLADEARGLPAPYGSSSVDLWRRFPLYVDEVQWGFELECRARGFATMLGAARADSAQSMTDIAGRVDGVAVLTRFVDEEELAKLARRMPVVLISQLPHDGIDRVISDNRAGISLMIEHLVEDHGLQNLVFVGDDRMAEFPERLDAFERELSHRGLPARRPPIAVAAMPLASTESTLDADVRANGAPDAYVCASDQIALSVLDGVQTLGLRVPTNVAVTGFDGVLAGRLSRPSITTVQQPMIDLGRLAARSLIARLDEPTAPPVDAALGVHLVRRESCGCGPTDLS